MKPSHAAQVTATAVLGSFTFGYSLASMNATENIMAHDLRWCAPDTIYCRTHILYAGIVTAAFFMGTSFGSLSAGWLASYGRRRMILIADAIVACASIVAATCPHGAPSISVLISARLLSGVGCGLFKVLVPMYVSELTPTATRSSYLCLHQVLITFGIFAAVAAGSLLSTPPPRHGTVIWMVTSNEFWWRAMLCAPVVPCFVQAMILLTIYRNETPNQYLSEDNPDVAREIIEQVYGTLDVDAAFNSLRHEHVAARNSISLFAALRTHRSVLSVGILFAIIQQLIGINYVVAQSNAAFIASGLSGGSAEAASVVTLFIHFAVTCTVVRSIGSTSLRIMLLQSFGGMAAAMALSAAVAFMHFQTTWPSYISVFGTMVFIFFFARGVGPLTWVIVAKLFPLPIRAQAMAIATSSNQLFAFIVLMTTSVIDDPRVMYCSFALMSLLGVFFVQHFLAEEDLDSQEMVSIESDA